MSGPFNLPLGPQSIEKTLAGLRRDVETLKRWNKILGGYQFKLFADERDDIDEVNQIVYVADALFVWMIPENLDHAMLREASAYVSTAGSGGITVQVRKLRSAAGTLLDTDMLTTPITIDAGKYTSLSATTAPVLTPTRATRTVTAGDQIAFDVDADGGGVAKGLGVDLFFWPAGQGPPALT